MSSESGNFGLTVRFRGVRGSIPSPGRETARYGGNTSCVELRCDRHLLILDAGSGIRALGNDLLLEFGSAPIHADILISHTHWDHIQGFPFFAPAYSAKNRIRVFQSRGITRGVEQALHGQMQSPHFPVAFDQMRGLTGIEELGSESVEVGPYVIRSTALNHPGGCAGFRIETKYGSVAYLPDHEPFGPSGLNGHSDVKTDDRRGKLIEFLSGTDLLILDTQYTEEEYARHIGWGHGSLPESVALAMDAKARHLALFHHDPGHRDYQIDLMVEAARKLAEAQDLKVSAAMEMDTVFLPSRRLAVNGLPNKSRELIAPTLPEQTEPANR
jgi:phosphoribosyl 1,2-cyclic phosphodiesterase